MPTNNSSNYSPTQYTVQTGGANGLLNSLAVGTAGQVLTSAGAGVQPGWATASAVGASITLIQTQDAANVAQIDFTTSISSYNNLLLVFDNLSGSATTTFQMRISTDGGSTFLTTNYQSGFQVVSYNGTTFANQNGTGAYIISGNLTNTAGDTSSGVIFIQDIIPSGSSAPKIVGYVSQISTATAQRCLTSGYHNAATTNALRLFCGSGNIKTGKFSLYGISQ